MKLFLQYLKQKRIAAAVAAASFVIFCTAFILYRLPLKAVLYPFALSVLIWAVFTAFDFAGVKRRHKALEKIQCLSDIVTDDLPSAESVESADYQNIIRIITSDHNAMLESSAKKYSDMIDYYTVWAHQIKTPIASMRLTLQGDNSAISRKLSGELFRIEQYVEMVLTFLRLNSDSTDYLIKEYNLDDIIRQSVKKFAGEFIDRKISLDYTPLNIMVTTDEKWLSFVIEQVLSNALKYTPSGSITISLYGKSTLMIKDTGIGIMKSDLPRIFENGYTGYNGRSDKKASGIGLYLCRRICKNLGHTISAESEVYKGTSVFIDFSQKKSVIE